MDRDRVYNVVGLKDRRRELRQRSTQFEDILWQELRNNKLGWRFKRQYSVRGYVIDFCCPRKRLGIEIDGSVHNAKHSKIHDVYRTRYLNAFGIKIIRFWNSEVLNNLSKVVTEIANEINTLPTIPRLTKEREGRSQGEV